MDNYWSLDGQEDNGGKIQVYIEHLQTCRIYTKYEYTTARLYCLLMSYGQPTVHLMEKMTICNTKNA